MMIGMIVNAPVSACTISRVTGYESLPYHSPTNHAEKPALITPMNSITKNAGLRNTYAMSKRASATSWVHAVAKSARGIGSRSGAAVVRTTASSAAAGVVFAVRERTSKWNSRQASANSAAATPIHSRRLDSSTPDSGGSSVLRSTAVQYFVTLASADSPNGSTSDDSVSCCRSRSHTRDTEKNTSMATAPT